MSVELAGDPAPSTPDLNPVGSPSSSDSEPSSDDSSERAAADAADHYVNASNGVHHLSHESDVARLRCGKLKSSFKSLLAADCTAAYSSIAERCKGCYR